MRTIVIQCALAAGMLAAFLSLAASPQESNPKSIETRLEEVSAEMRREIGALQYVLTPSQLDELLSLRYDHSRRRWIEEYWASRDPVFTTPDNEIRNEHDRRVAYAESAFFMPKWPMWDQRGEVFIRYGPPTLRQIIRAEVDQVGSTAPGELWHYSRHDMYVLFQDVFGRGEYTYYLERVKGPPGLRLKKIAGRIDASAGYDLAAPEVARASGVERFQKMINRFYEVQVETPSTYPFDFQQNRLPFFFGVDNFRGGKSVNRVEVNLEFIADFGKRPGGERTNEYVATAVFWDAARKEVGRRQQRLEVPVAQGAADSTRLMPAQLVFSLPPGFYHMAVTLQEAFSGRVSSYRTEVACESFENKLAISDILFASKIRETERLSPFNRGGLEVVPHPIRRYGRVGSIPVYFEVYNLAVDSLGLASYTVEYRIVSRTPRKVGFWESLRGKKSTLDVASSFRASSYGTHDPVHVMIGSENLWEGVFALRVKISDGISLAETSREAVFNIVE